MVLSWTLNVFLLRKNLLFFLSTPKIIVLGTWNLIANGLEGALPFLDVFPQQTVTIFFRVIYFQEILLHFGIFLIERSKIWYLDVEGKG